MLKNYEDFVDEILELQRDRPKGVGLARTLRRKNIVLKRYGINTRTYLWDIPLEILDEILVEIKRSNNESKIKHKSTSHFSR